MSLQPPPRHNDKFDQFWKDWLFFLFKEFLNKTGTDITGDFGFALKRITTSVDSPYTLLIQDVVLLVNPDSADCVINLPAISSVPDGRMIYIKNIDKAATGYDAVPTRNGSDVIDDGAGSTATTIALAASESTILIADNTNSTWQQL